MLGAGQRDNRVRFERRAVTVDDGYGNDREAFATLFDRWAGFRPKFGREQIEAGRLESNMQGTLTVLADPETKTITAADRVVFVSGPYAGKACQIRSLVPTPDAREIEVLIEEGVAT
jgi:head-tail adaptor